MKGLAVPVALLALAACQPSLEDARAAWERTRPNAYVFEYQPICSCPGSGAWWRITVRGNSVETAEPLDTLHVDLRPRSAISHPTVSEVFDGIAKFANRPHAWMKAHYDRRWHYPTRASGDVTTLYDAHWQFLIRNFQPIK